MELAVEVAGIFAAFVLLMCTWGVLVPTRIAAFATRNRARRGDSLGVAARGFLVPNPVEPVAVPAEQEADEWFEPPLGALEEIAFTAQGVLHADVEEPWAF